VGSLVIPDDSLICIDTSIAIYTVEQVPVYAALLEPLWEKFAAGGFAYVVVSYSC
jgi:hypothetical protein